MYAMLYQYRSVLWWGNALVPAWSSGVGTWYSAEWLLGWLSAILGWRRAEDCAINSHRTDGEVIDTELPPPRRQQACPFVATPVLRHQGSDLRGQPCPCASRDDGKAAELRHRRLHPRGKTERRDNNGRATWGGATRATTRNRPVWSTE